MNRKAILLLSASMAFAAADALAQAKLTRDKLVGAWEISSVEATRADGSKFDPWAGKLVSTVIFLPNGRYSVTLVRNDLPKIAAKDRMKGTPEEYQAIVQGTLTHFGTYSLDEATGVYTLNVEGSSYPNDVGTKQSRKINMFTGDEMQTTNPTPTTGTSAVVRFRRVK